VHVRDFFYILVMFLFQPGLDLKAHLKTIADNLRQKGLRLQPHVVVICEDLSDIGSPNCVAFAVITSELFFEVNSIMSAVDSCFKACFVFNIHICQASQSSRLFLQRAVYDISTPHD